ncbi:MAG: class I SAM-dependent methyltransferase [Sphingomonadaceae bacterium]|nr:class I SAM-dependent methyltransferase [Sphingomonadaceae bacterium]
MPVSPYYDKRRLTEVVQEGRHRGFVGGLWTELGQLQLDFMKSRGLTPDMRLLDVGCGCLRAGVEFVRYLDAGRYFGIDLSQELLDIGYEIELADAGLQTRLPKDNLFCTETFDASKFAVKFDMAIANSVFTHLPVNHLKLCLIQLSEVMRAGSTFYATFFVAADLGEWRKPIKHQIGGVTTFPEKNPFHHMHDEITFVASTCGWSLDSLGPWSHPRNQWIAEFRHVAERR